jgi:hypothetical protein
LRCWARNPPPTVAGDVGQDDWNALVRLEARCEITEVQFALAERQLADLRRMLDDIKSDRDQWRDQAQRLALPNPSRRWWQWRRAG